MLRSYLARVRRELSSKHQKEEVCLGDLHIGLESRHQIANAGQK